VRIILDTNVFVAGVFFSGPPYAILDAWRKGQVLLIVSPEIMEEYRRVCHELAQEYPPIDPGPTLELLAIHAHVVHAPPLPAPVCTDPSDDMFLACALAGNAQTIVSGDKALLRASGHRGIKVLTPRAFVDSHLT
jgi:uncharacterized protein